MNEPPDYRLEAMDESTAGQAKELVDLIFPQQTPAERMSFRVWSWRDRPLLSRFGRVFGVHELRDFWVALDDDDRVKGITGLYVMRKDRHEALWLGWYCVHPDERGKGLGGTLLRKAVDEARSRGVRYLRLYTSDHPSMERAQQVYEKEGFRIIEEKRLPAGFLIHRPLRFEVIYFHKIVREKTL
ncbi:MAG: GNAT family N-acetyltransferase [Candidatus Methanomethylophilaceae archaeon]